MSEYTKLTLTKTVGVDTWPPADAVVRHGGFTPINCGTLCAQPTSSCNAYQIGGGGGGGGSSNGDDSTVTCTLMEVSTADLANTNNPDNPDAVVFTLYVN